MKKKKMPNPDKPLTAAEFKSMKWVHGLDGLASIIGEENVAPLRLRGRPKVAAPKASVNIRIDEDVLSVFRKTGKGWQTRLNSLLREAVEQGLV